MRFFDRELGNVTEAATFLPISSSMMACDNAVRSVPRMSLTVRARRHVIAALSQGMADSEPHAEAEPALAQNQALDDLLLLHSTSWRVDGPAVMVTYIAVISSFGLVRDRWPDARPVRIGLATAVGKPPVASPVEPPEPRYIDVLMHALRHIRFLLETDDTNSAVLDQRWRRHLASLEPALAGMYRRDRDAA
ncbi:hypothetical protein GCM10023322_38340 [Rugosimonospora acidiphila]|uniref:Uncharacterized protein n=1 Tax=Rugosimonospora acidiphila TaxID=556531 RepID=A0ABP9RXS6_9ACTN